MSDETKATPPPPEEQKKPEAAKPPAAAPPVAKPAAPAGAAPAKPAPPAKPAGPTPQPWDSEMVAGFKQRFGSGIKDASTYLGQPYMVVDSSIAYQILQMMRDAEQFDYCVDVTCVHYPQRELHFEVVWILYSFGRNERVRIKTQIADGQSVKSVVELWPTANWLEREAFDMFGVRFEGHPDLKRILLPDGWKGHPLRKDYGIIQQDNEWVKINLGIESGQ